jgi:phytoene/squalene synthetase
MPNVTIKAKRDAIIKAYGCYRVEDDMDNVYYARRDLAKLPDADERGFYELKYQHEQVELADAIERTLQTIRQRDGMKYYKEVAADLIDAIASDVKYRAGR